MPDVSAAFTAARTISRALLSAGNAAAHLKAMRTPEPEGPRQSSAALPGMPAVRPALAESPLAPKAAAALGMLFPYVGLPAGMIFLMLDDPRKTQLGWMLIGWSLAGTAINVISLVATLGPVWALLRGMLPHSGGAAPTIPGLPTDSGTGLILLFLSCFSVAFQ